MDKLPRVFANPINKELSNVQNVYCDSLDRTVSSNPKNINRKINEIFASTSHVYKSKVKITYSDSTEEAVIVGKTNINLLTIDGKLIKITDIVDIEKI
ncbi:MAG: hypothetical protein K2M17_01815 [Bacilli bacterium]|nr:hypothetical protein [Bacilli bacterium]